MPNHCSSTLFLVAPTAVLDDILDAMEGPIDWFFPEGMVHSPGETHALLSGKATEDNLFFKNVGQGVAHIVLGLEAGVQRALADRSMEDWRVERDRRLGWPQPDWLPLTTACIARMVADPAWPAAIPLAPLSMPKLLERNGSVERVFTRVAGDLDVYRQGWALDTARPNLIIPVRERLVGTKWGIYDPMFDRDEDVYVLPEPGWSAAVVRYSSAWSPLSSLESALAPLLEGHDARVLLVLDDGGGSYGCEFFHPDEDASSDHTIDIEPPEDTESDDEDVATEAQDRFTEELPRMLLEQAAGKVDDPLIQAAVDAFIDAHWNDDPASIAA